MFTQRGTVNDESGNERQGKGGGKKSVFKNLQGFCKSSIYPPASFLYFGTQIYPTLSTGCWVGFRAKQAPVMDRGKAEAETK